MGRVEVGAIREARSAWARTQPSAQRPVASSLCTDYTWGTKEPSARPATGRRSLPAPPAVWRLVTSAAAGQSGGKVCPRDCFPCGYPRFRFNRHWRHWGCAARSFGAPLGSRCCEWRRRQVWADVAAPGCLCLPARTLTLFAAETRAWNSDSASLCPSRIRASRVAASPAHPPPLSLPLPPLSLPALTGRHSSLSLRPPTAHLPRAGAYGVSPLRHHGRSPCLSPHRRAPGRAFPLVGPPRPAPPPPPAPGRPRRPPAGAATAGGGSVFHVGVVASTRGSHGCKDRDDGGGRPVGWQRRPPRYHLHGRHSHWQHCRHHRPGAIYPRHG